MLSVEDTKSPIIAYLLRVVPTNIKRVPNGLVIIIVIIKRIDITCFIARGL